MNKFFFMAVCLFSITIHAQDNQFEFEEERIYDETMIPSPAPVPSYESEYDDPQFYQEREEELEPGLNGWQEEADEIPVESYEGY